MRHQVESDYPGSFELHLGHVLYIIVKALLQMCKYSMRVCVKRLI